MKQFQPSNGPIILVSDATFSGVIPVVSERQLRDCFPASLSYALLPNLLIVCIILLILYVPCFIRARLLCVFHKV